MKTKSMILLTAALCGFALAPVAMSQPKGDAFADPKAPAAEPPKEESIVVTVLADGKVMVEGQTITVAELTGKLKMIIRESPDQALRIKGDESVSYQRFVTVLDACREAGVRDIAMGQPKGDAPANPKTYRATGIIVTDGKVLTEHLVRDMKSPSDLLVRYEVFSLDPAKAAAMRHEKPADGKFYADLVAMLEKGEAEQESLMMVRCPSGHAGKVESVTRHEYATEYHSLQPTVKDGESADARPEPTPVIPSATGNRNVGTTLEVEPTKGENSPMIDLKIVPTHVGLAERTSWGRATSTTEMPIYETQNLNTNVMVLDGSPFLLGTISPPPSSKAHANKIWFAFITVTSTKQ